MKTNKLNQLEGDARDSIVAVLSDLAIRKLSAFVWYARTDKQQALRTLAAGVAFLDAAILSAINLDDDADIRREYLRIKKFVIDGCPEYEALSGEIDGLSFVAYYMNNDEAKNEFKADSLLEHW